MENGIIDNDAGPPEEGYWCEECKGSGDLGGGFECTYCQNADIQRRDAGVAS